METQIIISNFLENTKFYKVFKKIRMAATMEIDGQRGNSVASVTGGSVAVALHPLVIMNISEHWTRIKAHGKVVQGEIFSVILDVADH